MSDSAPQPDRSPESLYATWREAHDRGDGQEFDSYCADHPDAAAELRALHDACARLMRVLRPTPRVKSAQRTGSKSLDQVLERLRSHQPEMPCYEEPEVLREGGMGQLLRVRDVDLRRYVAKKVIRRRGNDHGLHAAVRPDVLGRFLEEAQVTAQLTHPGVVPVHELGIDEEGRVFYTMDLISGRDLAAVFEAARAGQEGWSVTRATEVLLRVCETLAYAHSRGVVHRDLKPSNVMAGAFGEVYVIDWGLAKIMCNSDVQPETAGEWPAAAQPIESDRQDASKREVLGDLLTEEGTATGTPGYMSPEQVGGDSARVDARTDVYALGAMLHALLTGHRPFHELLDEGLGRKLTHADLVAYCEAVENRDCTPADRLNPDAPPELVSIARKAMARDPKQRYASAKSMAEDLRRYLQGLVVEAHESGAWPTFKKWVLRNRALAASIAIAVLASVAGAVGIAWMERDGRLRVERQQLVSELQRAPTMYAGLEAGVETIWPAVAENIPAMERWFVDLSQLRELRPRIDEAVAVLDGNSGPFEIEALLAVGPNATDATDGVRESQLRDLRGSLASVSTNLAANKLPEAWMSERLAIARRLLAGPPDWEERWAAAREAIANSPKYGGLVLPNQRGLLPLGPDPASGLWEFAHLLSGDPPQRDPITNAWRVEASTGIVFVLMPGGTYAVGAPNVAAGHDLYDDEALLTPSPPFDVVLDPFFISKYETTQAQRERASRAVESFWTDDNGVRPAEMVSWSEATMIADRLELVLPSEAQWEVGARSGHPYRFGPTSDKNWLFDHVNTKDTPVDAGKPVAVGSLPANDFGLHETLGNVWEWTRDTYSPDAAPRPGDGIRSLETKGSLRNKVVMRGGSCSANWRNARVTYRYVWERQNLEPDVGVRFARAVER